MHIYPQVGDRGRSGSADISALQQQSQVIQTSINDVEQQLLLARQQHKQISLDQQISGEFYLDHLVCHYSCYMDLTNMYKELVCSHVHVYKCCRVKTQALYARILQNVQCHVLLYSLIKGGCP